MRLKWYGWLGLGIILVAEILLFAGQPFAAKWFTPIVWTGYILFADALALRLRGHSLIHERPREALMLAWISAGCWLLYEAYNVRLQNWFYVNVPASPLERNWAYLWSFATIMPGMFETADVQLGPPRREDQIHRCRAVVVLLPSVDDHFGELLQPLLVGGVDRLEDQVRRRPLRAAQLGQQLVDRLVLLVDLVAIDVKEVIRRRLPVERRIAIHRCAARPRRA